MMTFRFGDFGFTCRPMLGCFVLVFFVGICGLFIAVFTSITSVSTVVGESSAIQEPVHQVVEADHRIIERFGEPLEFKLIGFTYSSRVDGSTTVTTFEQDLSGPNDSGRLFAEVKQVGEESTILDLRIVTASEDVIVFESTAME